MKKVFKGIAIVLVLATLAVVGVSLAACNKVDPDSEFVVATNAEFAPFEYTDGDKFVGIDMDIAEIFADRFGQKLVIKDMEFDSVITSVGKNGVDVGMAGLTVNDERKKVVNFSDAYFNASQKLIVLATNSDFDDLTTVEQVEEKLSSFTNYKVGVQKGTTGELYIEGDEDWEFDGFENVDVVGYQNAGLAVQKLISGDIKAVCIDDAPAQYLVNKVEGVKLIDVALTDESYAFAVDKNQPVLLEAINNVIKEITADGTLDRIIQKYYDEMAKG